MNYILKLISLCFVAIMILNSCNDKQKLDTKIAKQQITKTNLAKISEEMQKTASNENIEYFVNAITRLGNTPDSIVGKTVSQLIEEQKKYHRDELGKTLLGTGARVELFLNHIFHYYGIQFLDDDPNQLRNNVVFDVTNISDKEIKRLEGHLSFYDPQGRLVRVFPLATGTSIPVTGDEKSLRFAMPFIHNPNSDDTLIRTRRDFQAIWTPKLIEFFDGTILEDITLRDLGR